VIDRRVPGLVLLLLAGGLYVGVVVPARRAVAVGEAELLRVQAESEPLRRQVAEGEPRRSAEEAWRQAGLRDSGSLTGLRRRLLQSAAGAPVSGVRLSVSAASPPLVARAHFAALGSFSDLLALAERLIGPPTGLVPERLHWTLTGSALSLELEGVVLGRTP